MPQMAVGRPRRLAVAAAGGVAVSEADSVPNVRSLIYGRPERTQMYLLIENLPVNMH